MADDQQLRPIVKLIPPPPIIPTLTRVVIYARVSSIHEAQETSLEAQISHFKKLAREKGWFLIDTYAERRSAKDSGDRPEFKRMISDSYDGRFNLILTKSISRFGRNTIETLQALQKLKGNGVDVYFDVERLHSIDENSTHIITILEAYAQEENLIRSENIKGGIIQSLKKPTSKLYGEVA